MMNPVLLDILPLIRQGYCCSQLLMLLLLQGLGQKEPHLVRAVHGFCYGMGATEGPCGLLSGGVCVLGYLAGRGEEHESALPNFAPLINEYYQWFTERTSSFGGTACYQIMNGLSLESGLEQARTEQGQTPNPALCGDLLAECWEKLCTLCEDYDVPMNAPMNTSGNAPVNPPMNTLVEPR